MNGNGNLAMLLWANTIGMSILAEAFRSASLFVLHTNGTGRRFKQHAQSFAFVQGSGLEMVIHTYGLEYDPDQLRSDFNYYLSRIVPPQR